MATSATWWRGEGMTTESTVALSNDRIPNWRYTTTVDDMNPPSHNVYFATMYLSLVYDVGLYSQPDFYHQGATWVSGIRSERGYKLQGKLEEDKAMIRLPSTLDLLPRWNLWCDRDGNKWCLLRA